MNLLTLDQLTRYFRQFQFMLRNDKEVSSQFRTLLLGITTCLVVYYAGTSIILEPKEKRLRADLATKAEIATMGSGEQLAELAPRIAQLQQNKKVILGEIEILTLREKFQREQWRSLGDSTRFNNIIFTMNQAAPISIDGKLLQMTLGEKRSTEMFEQQGISLAGQAKYLDVLSYLQYMEKSPEIGSIDNLTINSVPGEALRDTDSVHFSMLISRITLKDK